MRRVATALVPLALLGALLATAGSPASAAPPGNDDLSGATEIELGIELLYDLTEATADVVAVLACDHVAAAAPAVRIVVDLELTADDLTVTNRYEAPVR